jgi:HEAT repeat protein
MTRTTATMSALLFCAAFAPLRANAAQIAADKLPETPIAASPGAEATYLATLHAHVHKRWAENFLRLIGEKLELSNPLNAPTLAAEVDLVISGDGQLISSAISKSSGFPGFDDAVIEILHDAVPFPRAPLVVRSDDDNLRLHWVFARDQRRCSGVAVTRTYDPVAVSLPKLLHQGRRDEALMRVAMARNGGAHVEPQFTLLAIDWMKAALHEPWASVPMARTLAVRGDQDAVKWLKSAVRRPELAADAGPALVAAKVPVCPLVKDLFDSQNWSDHQTAALALATAGESACVPGLAKLLGNAKARPEARAAAAVALGVIEDPTAHKALVDATKEANPVVHGAAMLATIRQGAGRKGVFAMEVFLRDPSPDLRAAAVAGVVRAGGDANLADLYVLFKESDPRPPMAALRELERLKTEESTKLIQKLAHRPQLEVQKLAADILIRRNNRESLDTLKSYLDPSADPAMRGRALIVADDATLRAVATDPKLGIWVYRARLLNGQADQAADWFVAYGIKLLPPAQMDAMAEWIAHTPAPAAAPASAPTTTAAATH